MDGLTLNYVQSCGRLYATTDSPLHLAEAATLAACAEPTERSTLRFYWEEGVRNYCDNMSRYTYLMAHYDGMVQHLTR